MKMPNTTILQWWLVCLIPALVGFAGLSAFRSTGPSQLDKPHAAEPPNIIFFALDDLNDMINPLGHQQAKTPNLDRLAKRGTLFTNAHAPGTYCAPSRTAIWTGLQASTTGCYTTEIFFYDYPNLVPMQEAFHSAGYKTYGAGKLYHHRPGHVDLDGWTEFYARNKEVKSTGYNTGYHGDDLPLPDPYPYSTYYRETGREITGGAFLEWGPISKKDESKLMGVKRVKWICDLLKQKHEDPFFMAVGLYSPHYPNYAPQRYFDMYDLDKIELPEILESDADDLAPAVQKRLKNRRTYREKLIEIGAYKEAIRGYLAAVSYADGLLGEVLDALETSEYNDNTIVIVWSDQGYHLGEKGQWGKHTLWSETSRVPLIFAGPGIPEGRKVSSTAGLIDLYPTLASLCGFDSPHKMDGISLVNHFDKKPLQFDRNLLVPSHIRGDFSVVNEDYRYIYRSSGEEFYDVKQDPNEWNNLIGSEAHQSVIDAMRASAPRLFRKSATSTKKLKLVFEGESFHWESKDGSDLRQMTY